MAKKLKGVVNRADDNGFFATVDNKEMFFDYDDVSKAKTYFEWNKK
jgi:ribosome maturation factor RimP